MSTALEPSIVKAIDIAAETLVSTYGCKGPVPFPLPELRYAFDIWTAVLGAAEQPSFREVRTRNC